MSKSVASWFDVDRAGLAKLLADRSPAFVLFELVSNAWDTGAKVVEVTLESDPERRGYAKLMVGDDDPKGFADLSHSWTLFAESRRKGEAEKRGRFNLGEKLVLARCETAEIVTTTGGVCFDKDGRHSTRSKTATGSVFRASLRMTKDEIGRACHDFARCVAPVGVTTRFNGEELAKPSQIAVFDAVLPTVIADAEGNLRKSERRATVRLYRKMRNGIKETPTLFEMGIPVVELDDGEDFHVDCFQKVPLNSDRDNVTPAFLRALRVAILNSAGGEVVRDQDDASAQWVREAAGDERCSDAAIADVLRLRFGDNRVAYDPSDTEAVGKATAAGATIVHGGSMSAGEWENARRAEAILPAGKLYPSHMSATSTDDYRVIPEGELTRDMLLVRRLSKRIADCLFDGGRDWTSAGLSVRFIESPVVTFAASWQRVMAGPCAASLTFNVSALGRDWFRLADGLAEMRLRDAQLELLLHEFGHHRGGSNHLTDEYHAELCRLGVRLANYVAVNRWPSEGE